MNKCKQSCSLNGCFLMIHIIIILFILSFKEVRAALRDEVETVEVTEGTNITLISDFTGIKSTDVIAWTYVTTGTKIAQLVNRDIVPLDEKRFRNRLKMDMQTGSLTISNISITDSGVYNLHIINNEPSQRQFNVTVYATLPIPNIISSWSDSGSKSAASSVCSVLCSVQNVAKVTLSWYKGLHLHSNTSDPDITILSLPLEVSIYDNDTYSCVVANPIRSHSKEINITSLCLPGDSEYILDHLHYLWLLIPVVLLLIAAMSLLYRNCTKKVQTHEDEIHYADAKFYNQSTRKMIPYDYSKGTEYTVYSAVVT